MARTFLNLCLQVLYGNRFELETCLKMSALKLNMHQPSNMFIAREFINKLRQYQILDCSLFQILEILYLYCLAFLADVIFKEDLSFSFS